MLKGIACIEIIGIIDIMAVHAETSWVQVVCVGWNMTQFYIMIFYYNIFLYYRVQFVIPLF